MHAECMHKHTTLNKHCNIFEILLVLKNRTITKRLVWEKSWAIRMYINTTSGVNLAFSRASEIAGTRALHSG